MLSQSRSAASGLPLLNGHRPRVATAADQSQAAQSGETEKACWCLSAVVTVLAIVLVCGALAGARLREQRDDALRGFTELKLAAMDAADEAAAASSLLAVRSKQVNAMLAEASAADGRIDHLQWQLAIGQQRELEAARQSQRQAQWLSAHRSQLSSQLSHESMLREAERRQSEARLAAAGEELSAAGRDLDEARRFGLWAERRIGDLESFAAGLRCRISELEGEVSRARSERDSAIADRDSCRREIDSLDSCIRSLRGELDRCRSQAAHARHEHH